MCVHVHTHQGILKTCSQEVLIFGSKVAMQSLWGAGSDLLARWLQDGIQMMLCVQGQPRSSWRGELAADLGST